MDQNKNSYNKIADQWTKNRSQSFLSELVIEFASRVKRGGKILDIGCGTGYPIAAYLVDQGFHVTGIDFSENLLQKAIALNLPNSNFELCDFFDYEPKDKYDGIIAFDSFFHFPKEKQESIYSKVGPWMEKDAYLLFTHGYMDGEITGEMFGEMFYYSSLDKNHVCQILAAEGMEVVWLKENYIEKNTDRQLVILAQKKAEL